MDEKIIHFIQIVLKNSNREIPDFIGNNQNLRKDLGFDSLMLAELTVHIEDEYDVDIFEDGMVNTINEIVEIIKKKKDNG